LLRCGSIRSWSFVGLLVAIVVIAFTRAAAAEYRHRVVLIEPAGEDGSGELRARLRGELLAAGFDVIALPGPSTADLREIENTARELHPAAVLFVSRTEREAEPTGGEIWLSDRLLRRTFVLKFSLNAAEPSRDTARVAVQVVEILKADLAELSLTRESPPPPPALPPAPVASVAPAPESTGFEPRIEAGAGMLQGFSGLGAAITPVLRAGGRLPQEWFGAGAPAFDVLASVAAFGGEVRIARPAGEARVKQTLATFGVSARFLPSQVAQPFLVASSGAYGVRVDGLGADGVGRSADTWSALSGGGGGLFLQPSRGVAIVLSGEMLAAWSHTIVNVAGQRAASAGASVLFLTVGVAGVF